MSSLWAQAARRIVRCLNLHTGDLILVCHRAERSDLLHELLLAIELAGATPLLDYAPPDYLERYLRSISAHQIAWYSKHRLRWIREVDRVVVLGGAYPDLSNMPPALLLAWDEIAEQLTRIEEARQLPMVVCAVPTQRHAERLGMSLDELEAHILPAFILSSEDAQRQISGVLERLAQGAHITIGSGQGCQLHLARGARRWASDDGYIDGADRQGGAIVSNLPAASVYTTVLETCTYGSLFVPQVHRASEVIFYFEEGRISRIEAASGGEELQRLLDSHSGEPRRISHIGIGLNPLLRRSIGWTLVDEHVAGAIFVALGENRYMGGQNESSLNYDMVIPQGSLAVDGAVIVDAGCLVAE
jgi:leucyl aminopeptidase (aminopeptidase T)